MTGDFRWECKFLSSFEAMEVLAILNAHFSWQQWGVADPLAKAGFSFHMIPHSLLHHLVLLAQLRYLCAPWVCKHWPHREHFFFLIACQGRQRSAREQTSRVNKHCLCSRWKVSHPCQAGWPVQRCGAGAQRPLWMMISKTRMGGESCIWGRGLRRIEAGKHLAPEQPGTPKSSTLDFVF